jgi:hypothetical protein
MKPSRRTVLSSAAVIICLAAAFAFNTFQNASHEDYRDSNFAKFWIAGHMVLSGLNPYDPGQWTAQHHLLGAATVPDRIFLYPLPQAFFLVPLALVPAAASFLVWSLVSQFAIAAACYVLFRLDGEIPRPIFFLVLIILLLFFGPVYLGLQIGSIGAIALLTLVASLILLRSQQSLAAGIVLSLLILKPSQGLPLLVLLSAWFLFHRNLRAPVGMLLGGTLLLVMGLLYDPGWVSSFLTNSSDVSSRTLGLQSNVLGLASLVCARGQSCTWVIGGAGILAVLGLGTVLLWRNRSRWTDWQAFNLVIPLGFLASVYSWSYDQLLYLVPMMWIVSRLLKGRGGSWLSLGFLLGADVVAFIALGVQANTRQDVTSIATTLLVLGTFLVLQRKSVSTSAPRTASIDKLSPPA